MYIFALLEWFWWFIYFFFQKYQKFHSNIFFIMNNTPGKTQRQGAEPRRASALNAIFNPKPHSHCKHSKFCNQNRSKRLFYSSLMDGSDCKRTVPLQSQCVDGWFWLQKNRPFVIKFGLIGCLTVCWWVIGGRKKQRLRIGCPEPLPL